ncbi:Asc-type amino acid transporter 1, partial [Globisporangium splendens]
MKILDIGAIRPSQTPLHIYRQVIFLGDVTNAPAGSISSTQRVAQASHVMILWDDQVVLSRLFHIGDELSIFQPYIHICEPHATEIVHIFNEYSSQQRCIFYLEYGSATVLFLNPQSKEPSSRNANGNSDDAVARRESEVQAFRESELPPLRYEEIKHEWLNFSVYGHVSSIRVTHGTPLMAAYFYSYYDPKTNTAAQQDPRATASASAAAPTLDRAIVSKFYLVVLLEIYNASSKQTLAVEVTGGNVLKALRLRPGQTVFLDGLVAVDVQHPAIRKTREHGGPHSHLPSQVEAAFAFQSADYVTKTSGETASSLVALCSDWESIFGQQSMLRENSRLSIVSSTPGLLATSLGRSPQLMSLYAIRKAETSQMGMVRGQMCITYVGWLIPEDETPQAPYSCDITCQRGFSTMCAHKTCMRHLKLVTAPPISQAHANGFDNASPRWRCDFCQEIFSGMEETSQTFCELVVRLDDGSTKQPVYAICYGETIEAILGVPAQDFSQLSLHDKATILQQTIGRDFQVVLSRCASHRVALTPQKHQQIDLRVDLIGPVDAFAAAHELLEALQQPTHR